MTTAVGSTTVTHRDDAATLIAALLQDRFESLDAPPRLLAADDTPVPYAGPLEDAWAPDAERIADAVRATVAF